MERFRLLLSIAVICGGSIEAAAAATEHPAARVLILANRDDPDSVRIARHYAEMRGVPSANVIMLSLPLTESVTWREFVTRLWNPLVEQLLATKWIDAIPMALTDPVGRRKIAPYRHGIAAIVVCRGVPLKITHDPALYIEAPPFTARAEFRTNGGAVDAELSMIAAPNYPINAFVPNPLFQNERPSVIEQGQVVKVSRLDGPTAEEANALVDRALVAERTGLLGRGYVDIANRDNIGDPWLESVAKQLAELGFDTSIDRNPATFPITARMDAPVLYFGWYTDSVDGPFRLPGFRFPPGAIALHIYSYSAATLRSSTQGWTGPFVARGVTATVGNVDEPYLQFTHQPQLMFRALARGATLAEAAYFSLTALSWQAILIGDPLYRPFAVPLAEQMTDISKLPPRLAGYAVLRQMRLLEGDKRSADATALGMSAQRQVPSLAVGVTLARRFQDARQTDKAANALGFVSLLSGFEANEWALAREAAQLLESMGQPGSALAVWRTLLANKTMPRELRVTWLPEAKIAALAAKEPRVAEGFQRELSELTIGTTR